jgi:glucose-1-phosphate cytidylyltransferase
MKDDTPVIILCGGFGTRLGSETENLPKPMIPIGGRPILWHIMSIYSHWGFNDFILALGYKADRIKDYFLHYRELNDNFEIDLRTGKHRCLNDCASANWNVKLVDTGLSTLKGGRIKRLERHVASDDFFLTYGDGVADIDIAGLLEFHRSHGKTGTITGVNPPSRFGEMMVKGNRVLSFSEKPQVSQGLINGGFFAFRKELFDMLTPDEGCDFEHGPLEELARQDRLRVFLHKGMWECMDTVRDMTHLNKMWDDKLAFWRIWKDQR